MRLLTLFLLILPCLTDPDVEDGNSKDIYFDVKPGNDIKHYEHIDETHDFMCKFTYACQGGTNEKWMMHVDRSSDDREFSCSIERPGGTSYLFFQHFKLEVQGVQIDHAEAFSKVDKLLRPEEYTISKTENYVMHSEGKFDSTMSKVAIYAIRSHDEL